ncbi:fumarylacetoacetate hydrolase family protein [Pseudonocardia kujensis]|uniref:fumarylacetoacetate hydrolase family protein n=1 Tax=Pseudonocardia kujensis TaxID=1128675 RepID=UPI001E38F58E|nr:fumarylacetoacetate hydrolase family protein [Pseudonocardia kujensis]MCE0763338.1 fumarylacetoacetate hydrolase family protein [Pseudonocardia kujensis]
MRIIGYELAGEVHVAARRDHDLIPLGPVTDFWHDPDGAIETGLRASVRIPASSVRLAPPVKPSARILCVGLNYREHAAEGPFDVPDHPTIFGRWTPSLAVGDTPVRIPVDEDGLDWEAELLVVVGRPLSCAEPHEVEDAIFGYAAFNDITARRAQKLTTQWTLGKNADRSGPMSDLVTRDEVGELGRRKVISRVNGQVMQEATTDEMIFGVADVLAFISRTFALTPGDMIATGTPSGVGYARTPPRLLQPGDVVEVEVEGIGVVSTPVEDNANK